MPLKDDFLTKWTKVDLAEDDINRYHRMSSGFGNTILNKLYNTFDQFQNQDSLDQLKLILALCKPNIKDDKIKIYKTKANRDNRTRTVMKPGRALKFMFDSMSQQDLHTMSEWFMDNYVRNKAKFTFHHGTSRMNFRHIYSHDRGSADGNYSRLNGSCFHYKFHEKHEYDDTHPCEFYASGDFMAIWIENEKGQICSRSMVCINPDTVSSEGVVYAASPYSAGDVADRTLRTKATEFLKTQGYKSVSWSGPEDGKWKNARFLKLQHPLRNGKPNENYIIGPYVDGGGNFELDKENPDKYIRMISGRSEGMFDPYNGWVKGTMRVKKQKTT